VLVAKAHKREETTPQEVSPEMKEADLEGENIRLKEKVVELKVISLINKIK
jgi:hypothetical protein